MKLSNDESRALAFVALLLLLSAGVRVAGSRGAAGLEGLAALDTDSLEGAGRVEKAAEERRSRPLGAGERIAVNTAPADELQRLPGVGPALAARIVAERERTGGFAGAAELDAVSGVGPKMLERLAPHLDFTGGPLVRRRGAAAGAGAAAAVDLNRATAAELERLPGVGPALAARIVAWRDSAGGFRSLDDLDRVAGIGPALLARIGPLLGPLP